MRQCRQRRWRTSEPTSEGMVSRSMRPAIVNPLLPAPAKLLPAACSALLIRSAPLMSAPPPPRRAAAPRSERANNVRPATAVLLTFAAAASLEHGNGELRKGEVCDEE